MTLANQSFADSDRVLFVSDVHLRYDDQAYLDQFLAFLRMVLEQKPQALYIHGDLFDFYVGPRQGRLPFYKPLFDLLSAIKDGGTKVGVIHGNRDFLMGKCFQGSGAEILPDEVQLQFGEQRTLLSHGDEH
jgi:UDP-2,3-diacylglucosamine hydrolase